MPTPADSVSTDTASAPRPAAGRRSLAGLILANALGGVGVASGIAVGTLVVQDLGSTALAGVGQALSVLGAGLAAVPLAGLAVTAGRRRALTLGFGIAALGAIIVLVGVLLHSLLVLFAGLLLFGCAQAANLQTRYAASDLADPAHRARQMSLVVWAATIGSAAGPNLAEVGTTLGQSVGVPGLGGPYLFSLASFALAAIAIALLLPSHALATAEVGRPQPSAISAPQALAWAFRHPRARFAVVLIVVAHGVMVGLMTMTSLHLTAHDHSLRVVGLVISLHVLGMYLLAPVFGWLADRIGALRLALLALVLMAVAVGLGWRAGWDADLPITTAALTLLGIGWSAALIGSSALLAGVDAGEVRVPLQGATDALMNYVGAAGALLSAPVLALVGYSGLSLACGVLLLPALAQWWSAQRSAPRAKALRQADATR